MASISLGIISTILIVEASIVLISALRRWKSGVWIVCLGFILFTLNINPLIGQDQIGLSKLYWVLLPLVSKTLHTPINRGFVVNFAILHPAKIRSC